MKKFLLFVLLVCFISVLPCIAQDIPFTIEKGLIVIPAKIRKDRKVEIVLATGLYMSAVDLSHRNGLDTLRSYGITLAYRGDGPVTGRNDRTIAFAPVSDIIVGNAGATDLNLALNSPIGASKLIGREIFAILGVDFFKGKIAQFDFEKKVVRFLEKSPFGSKDEGVATVDGKTRMTFKMMSMVQSPLNGESMVPAVNGITIDGRKLRTLMDTGHANPILLSPATVKDLALTPVPEKGKAISGQVKAVNIFDFELGSVPAVFYGKEAGFEQRESNYDAVFGLALLKNFTVTFDFKSDIVTLERAAQ